MHSLDSKWLYRDDGAIFGPVTARELLEMLYSEDISSETLIAPEDGAFVSLDSIEGFREHIDNAKALADEKRAAEAKRKIARKAALRRRVRWAALSFVSILSGSVLIYASVWGWNSFQAYRLRSQQQAQLKNIDSKLHAEVSVEPPLPQLKQRVQHPKPVVLQRTKPSPSPHLPTRTKKLVHRGPLAQKEIKAGVRRVFPSIARCIRAQVRKKSSNVPHTLELTFSINNQGRAQNVEFMNRACEIPLCFLVSELSSVRLVGVHTRARSKMLSILSLFAVVHSQMKT